MLATALIIPTVAAAVDALRSSVGIAQNAGRNAIHTLVRQNQKTIISFGPGRAMRQSNPTALMNKERQHANVFHEFCRNATR